MVSSNKYGILTYRSGAVPTVDVQLTVTNVFPLRGSLQGGTRLTVSGVGFGTDDSLVSVEVGDFVCDIQSLTDSKIICQIEDTARVHSVTNLGTHKGNFHSASSIF